MKKLSTMFVLLLGLSTGVLAADAGRPLAVGLTFNVAADRSTVQNGEILQSLIWSSGSVQDGTKAFSVDVGYTAHDASSDLYSMIVHITDEANSTREPIIAYARTMAANFQSCLDRAYEDARDRLDRQLRHALEQQEAAKRTLERLNTLESPAKNPSRDAVMEQLDTVIDLSELEPEVSASEAFDILRQSVDPPLSLVVLWKELLDMGDIEFVTPIDMEGIPEVRLGTALELLLKSLSGGFCDLHSRFEDDVIVVGIRRDASLDAQNLLAVAKLESADRLLSRRRDLRLKKEDMEMTTAQARARVSAIGQAVAQINKQIDQALKADPMVAKLEPMLKPLEEEVHSLQDRPVEEYLSLFEKLVSIRTRLAEHQMDVIARSGGPELSQLNQELRQLTIDLAADQAQLDKLNENLARVEQELAAVTRLEGRVNEIRLAEKALKTAQARVLAIEEKHQALQPPQVTVLGLE